MSDIKKRFQEADLPLTVANSAQEFDKRVRQDVKAFLLDIRRAKHAGKNENKQTYVMYKGDGNHVSIMSVDSQLRQLVLQVQEPDREVVTEHWERDKTTMEYKKIVEVTKVPSELRTFLLGMDEQHLFVAQLPHSVNSVKDAHKSLKPKLLKNKESKRTNFRRQGEWFFVKISEKTQLRLDNKVMESQITPDPDVKHNSAVGTSGGRPHRGDLVVRLDNSSFVKGEVKHPDHKTILFREWVEVFRNTEVMNSAIKGMKWID